MAFARLGCIVLGWARFVPLSSFRLDCVGLAEDELGWSYLG